MFLDGSGFGFEVEEVGDGSLRVGERGGSAIEVMVFGEERFVIGFDESTFDILEADNVSAVVLR